jgi:ribosome-binding ATPase YchF (GTP1/OBG family)
MSDDPTNSVRHHGLLYVVNKDHSKPSNENELDREQNITQSQKSLEVTVSFAAEAKVNVIKKHVKEKRILE